MIEDYEKKRRKQVSRMRSIGDYVMGILFLFASVFFFFRSQFDWEVNTKFPPDWKDIVLGIMFVLYGGWRIYRGYRKNYFL